jgi:hypothetical protein
LLSSIAKIKKTLLKKEGPVIKPYTEKCYKAIFE